MYFLCVRARVCVRVYVRVFFNSHAKIPSVGVDHFVSRVGFGLAPLGLGLRFTHQQKR